MAGQHSLLDMPYHPIQRDTRWREQAQGLELTNIDLTRRPNTTDFGGNGKDKKTTHYFFAVFSVELLPTQCVGCPEPMPFLPSFPVIVRSKDRLTLLHKALLFLALVSECHGC